MVTVLAVLGLSQILLYLYYASHTFVFWENVSMEKRKKGTKMSSKDKRKDQNAL